MAGSAVIGALRVDLGLNSANFSTGLKSSQKDLDAFAKKIAVGAAAVAAAATAMATALAVSIKKTIDQADELSKASQKFGVATDELSKLKYAADLSGVSLESLGKGIQRLSRNVVDASVGLKTPKAAFDALDISIKNADGTLRSSTDILGQVADRFAAMEDGTAKTAAALMLFGRAGGDLIPLLNGGSAGLKELTDEAVRLGVVIDSQTGRAAEAFNDNLTRLQRSWDGLVTKITAHLLPALELFSEKFIELTSNSEWVEEAANSVARAINWVANEVGQLVILGSRLATEFEGVAKAFDLIGNGDFAGAWTAFREGQEKSGQMAADLKTEIDNMLSGSAVSQGGIQRRIDDAFGDAGKDTGKKFVQKFAEGVAGEGQENAFEQMAARIKTSIDNVLTDADTVGMTTGAAAAYTAQMDLLFAAHEAGIPITAALQEQIRGLAEGIGNATMQLEGARLGMELMNDPFSVLQQELMNLQGLLESGSISWAQWSDAATRAKMTVASEVFGLAGQLTGALGKMFGDSKAFAIAEAVINTAQAITKTIAQYGATPFGLAAAGVAAATGAAQIAAIQRTNKGSSSAPGVSGAAGSSAGNANQVGNQQAVTINLQGETQSTQSVEALLASLNEAIGDGHKLIIRTT